MRYIYIYIKNLCFATKYTSTPNDGTVIGKFTAAFRNAVKFLISVEYPIEYMRKII